MADTTYTVVLNEAQQKALEYVAVDPAEWINNVVYNRCRMAIDEIYAAEVDRMINDPTINSIPADKEEVVLAADIKTAAEANAEAMASVPRAE